MSNYMLSLGMFLLLSCNNTVRNIDKGNVAFGSSRFLVYIEEPRTKALDFSYNNQIALFDLNDHQTHLLVNDSYLNEEPCIWPNGRYVVFVSAREGGSLYLKVAGDAAKRQVYRYDLVTGKLVQVLNSNGSISHLAVSRSAHGLYYIGGSRAIYFMSTDSESIREVIKLDSNYNIIGLDVSPLNNKLIFSYGKMKPPDPSYIEGGLREIDLTTHRNEQLPLSWGTAIHDWSQGGDSLLITKDSLAVYDVKLNKLEYLHVPDSLSILSPRLWNVDTLAFIGSRQLALSHHWSYDVYFYDIKDRHLIKLTDDGVPKSELRIYNKFYR